MMIVITSDNGHRIEVELRSDRIVFHASTTGRIEINRDDARSLRALLEHLV